MVSIAEKCGDYSDANPGLRFIHDLRSGILVLVISPMLICIGLVVMAYRKRNQFNED
jgi:hypothetical protein